MAPQSSTLAWKIPWMEKPGRLQSMGLLRVGHDWATSLSLSLSCIGEGNGNPLQCSCLENPRGGGAWWAAVYGVAKSRTWLKWLSNLQIKTISMYPSTYLDTTSPCTTKKHVTLSQEEYIKHTNLLSIKKVKLILLLIHTLLLCPVT